MTGPHFPPPDSGHRYYLHEYVCEGSYVRYPAEQGTVSMRMVLVRRPTRCRYAILTSPTAPDEVVVADLYEVPVATDGWVALGRHWIFPDIDSARAAAVLSYDHL